MKQSRVNNRLEWITPWPIITIVALPRAPFQQQPKYHRLNLSGNVSQNGKRFDDTSFSWVSFFSFQFKFPLAFFSVIFGIFFSNILHGRDILKIDSGSIFCLFVVVRRPSYCLCIEQQKNISAREKKLFHFWDNRVFVVVAALRCIDDNVDWAEPVKTNTKPSANISFLSQSLNFRCAGSRRGFKLRGLRRNIAKKRRREKKI